MILLRRLWYDEAGFIISTELVLIATLLVLAMIVGLQSVRDAVLAELADVAAAIGALNQSYSFAGVTGHASSVAGSVFIDVMDFCDEVDTSTGGFNQCVSVIPAEFEGSGT
jgi:Flp pilus assembly pilin Flp